jgi:hypothetical protein|tara:strand:+ start:605 stop:1093 length:489 start_codon:yes stop_codon:yes gene_type:complete
MNKQEEHDKFVTDLEKGEVGEQHIIDKFTGINLTAYKSSDKGFDYRYSDVAVYYKDELVGLIEVKSEQHQWEITQNHYLEYEYNGKPSGIAATEATHWALLLYKNNNVEKEFIVPTNKLKEIARDYINTDRDVAGGDNNKTKGILMPIDKIQELQELYVIKS